MINLYNKCSLEAMRSMDTTQYDLAIVDPPYGFTRGMSRKNLLPGKSNRQPIYKDLQDWNDAPGDEYFLELRRVSKNQIVWGGNYFPQLWNEPARCFVFWDKRQVSKLHAMGELAWTSFDRNALQFRYRYCGFHEGSGQMTERVHPTQKPVPLYYWLLEKFSKPGEKILDTHLGSGSIALACHDFGVSLDGFEISEKYYKAAQERLAVHTKQLALEF